MAVKDTVELRVLRSGVFTTPRGPLLKGMRYRASSVEAYFLQRWGVCERIDGGLTVPIETRERGPAVMQRPTIETR